MSRKLELELELKICEKVVDCLLDAGYEITVEDEYEESSFNNSRSKNKLMEAIKLVEENNDIFQLIINRDKKTSWVKLIFGNCEDIISDYTVDLEEILKPAMEFANSYCD